MALEKIKSSDKSMTVLVIDDNKQYLHDFQDYLQQAEVEATKGISFVFAEDVKAAMKVLAEKTIDVIVMEVVLPTLSGYFLLEYLQKQPKMPEVYIYSKLKSPFDIGKMAAYKLNDILLKKLTGFDQLIEILSAEKLVKQDLEQRVRELQVQLKDVSHDHEEVKSKLLQCPRCHMVLTRDSYFCNNCGQKIAHNTQPTKE